MVNSETEINPKWNLFGSIPPFSAMLDSYSSIAIARYNVETVALLRESLRGWEEQIRQSRCPAVPPDRFLWNLGPVVIFNFIWSRSSLTHLKTRRNG
jgi:hypothetical protein